MSNNSFSLGGIDYGARYISIVQPFSVPVLTDHDVKIKSIVGRRGAYNFGATAGERKLSLPCRIAAPDSATFYANALLCARDLSPLLGEQILTLDCVTGKYLMAMVEKGFTWPKLGNMARFTLPFVCADPYWFSATQTISDKAITSTPQQITETPGGTADSEPVWEIIPTTTIASGTDIIIQNFTSNQKMTWRAPSDITSADVVRIDSANYCVYINGVRSIATIQPASGWPLLVGGVTNVIRVTGMALGTLRITYRERWQ
ncbi:phage tail family protein [Candidatus Pacearchaeota archaeon]|jgi:phage-related protein|nr:phage tail family protein [Candidatus Pacearchaeota archaeon]